MSVTVPGPNYVNNQDAHSANGYTVTPGNLSQDAYLVGFFSGQDKIIGGSGNDILIANGADNLLTGGGGKNVFEFLSNPTGIQFITDFSSNDIIIFKSMENSGGSAYFVKDDTYTSSPSSHHISAAVYVTADFSSYSSNALNNISGNVNGTLVRVNDGSNTFYLILQSNSDLTANLRVTNTGNYSYDSINQTLTQDSFVYLYSGTATVSNNTWIGNTVQADITENTFGTNGLPSTGVVYHWNAGGTTFTTNTKYLPVAASYFGQGISVYATYTDAYGNAEHTDPSAASVAVNGVFDTAEHVSTYLDVIEAHHTDISNALNSSGSFHITNGANTATTFTAAQVVSDVDALALIANNHYLVNVKDTAFNFAGWTPNIIAHINQISSITFTDSASIVLHGTDAISLASAFTSGNDFHTHAVADMLYNVATDGTLYIKTSGGTLGTVTAGSSILFNDLLGSTASLANYNDTPFFHSSGGLNGLTLPDLFTGPSSLGLTYQLIDSTQNAVVTGASSNDFIKVSDSNSIGKAVNGGGGNDVIDGGVGSTFVTGGDNHNDTFFLDGRAPGVSWSTITDFKAGTDKATIWGFVKGVSSIDTSFTNYDHEGAAGYQGLTLHFKNLLPDGQTAGSNPNLNSITFTGHTLAELGASSLADLNAQINAGTNAHILVGSTQDSLGTHSYLYFH